MSIQLVHSPQSHKKIHTPMLRVGYCGNKKLYDIDLDVLGEVE